MLIRHLDVRTDSEIDDDRLDAVRRKETIEGIHRTCLWWPRCGCKLSDFTFEVCGFYSGHK